MTAARKHLSHGLLLLLLAPVLLRRQGRNPAETCGLRSPIPQAARHRAGKPWRRSGKTTQRSRHAQQRLQSQQSLFDMRHTALRLTGSTAETATGHDQNGCVRFLCRDAAKKTTKQETFAIFAGKSETNRYEELWSTISRRSSPSGSAAGRKIKPTRSRPTRRGPNSTCSTCSPTRRAPACT